MSVENRPAPPTEVPADLLSAEAVGALIESFILREGTDYGATEVAYETKVLQVRRQLETGLVKIVFDADTETVTLIKSEVFKKQLKIYSTETRK